MARIARRPNPASLAVNQVLHYGQAKAGAALFARPGLVHAVEALKDAFEGLRRYPRAIILDRDLYSASL
jgi:hypothetical protein